MSSLARAIATWFGAGYWPKGPGTAGSIGAVLPVWAFAALTPFPSWGCAVLALVFTPAAIWAAGVTGQLEGNDDPQIVVVDEVVGQWLAMSAMPSFEWKYILAAFVLFRTFDIWKPWPVRNLERLHGGFGIVADDLAAGVWAAVVLLLVRVFQS
jgi:phosphatidylglycerophosphatase A